MTPRFHTKGRDWFASPDQRRAPDGSRYQPMIFGRPVSLWSRAARDAAGIAPLVLAIVFAFLILGPK